MKAKFNVTPNLQLELEAPNQKELFRALANVQEVFGNFRCGKCKKTNLKFVVRTVDDNDYYELHCQDCFAKLGFGSHKKGDTLFPKRKDDDGYLPDNGWLRWDKDQNKLV